MDACSGGLASLLGTGPMNDSIRRVAHSDGVTRPYSAATVYGGLVFPCGQVPVRADGSVPSTLAGQVITTIDNLERALVAAGSGLDRLLQVTVYLADLADFDDYNQAYVDRMTGYSLPPRTTIAVQGFRGSKRVEISAVAASNPLPNLEEEK